MIGQLLPNTNEMLQCCYSALLPFGGQSGKHLQEFAKSTWHPSIFGKTEKIVLQQFGIQLGKF
jgi:hypothetical protein